MLLNNSATSRRYRFTASVAGTVLLNYLDGATVPASATNEAMVTIRFHMVVHSTSDVFYGMEVVRTAPSATNTRQAIATTTSGQIWAQGTNDQTGAKLLQVGVYGQNTTATQQFETHSVRTVFT